MLSWVILDIYASGLQKGICNLAVQSPQWIKSAETLRQTLKSHHIEGEAPSGQYVEQKTWLAEKCLRQVIH